MKSHYRFQKRLSTKQFFSALATLFLGTAAAAYAATIPNTFTAGTAISSSQVNSNFTALNNALPLVWADSENTPGGISVTASAPITVNSVSITVPAGGGFIIISGSAYINNDSATPEFYTLTPQIDAVAVTGSFGAALVTAAHTVADLSAGEVGTLSYTLTVPISAGAHTVSQLLGPGVSATANFFYNRQNLTVQFIPASQGNVTPTITPYSATMAPVAGKPTGREFAR